MLFVGQRHSMRESWFSTASATRRASAANLPISANHYFIWLISNVCDQSLAGKQSNKISRYNIIVYIDFKLKMAPMRTAPQVQAKKTLPRWGGSANHLQTKHLVYVLCIVFRSKSENPIRFDPWNRQLVLGYNRKWSRSSTEVNFT